MNFLKRKGVGEILLYLSSSTLVFAAELPSQGDDEWSLVKHQDYGYIASIESSDVKGAVLALRCVSERPTIAFKAGEPLGELSSMVDITFGINGKSKSFIGKLYVDKNTEGFIPSYLNHRGANNAEGFLLSSSTINDVHIGVSNKNYSFSLNGFGDALLVMNHLCQS